MKKLISVIMTLALVLSLSVIGFAAEGTCIVAGKDTLCGSNWDMNDTNNAMTLVGGIYTITYEDVAVGDYQFKVVDNGNWIGIDGQNVAFTVSSVCDVTITYDPATQAITYTGSGVGETTLDVQFVVAVGAASETFLNNVTWDPTAESNKMAEADGVYTITYTGVAAGTYEFKFAANGNWDLSWGTGAAVEVGTEADAAVNGSNCSLTVTEDDTTVTLKLDLTNIDGKGNGAKCTVIFGEVDVPGTDDGETDVPGTDDGETDVPGTDDGATDVPGTDDGATDVPGTDDGATDVPGTDDGATDVPGTDDGATDVPGTDDGETEEPDAPVVTDELSDYYVAGVEALCGTNWVENDPNNNMFKGTDGLCYITYENVAAGEYKLKVTKGTWSECWGDPNSGDPDGNCVFTLTETSDVTVAFNPETGVVYILIGDETVPETGDMGLAAVAAALLVAATGVVAICKKKEF